MLSAFISKTFNTCFDKLNKYWPTNNSKEVMEDGWIYFVTNSYNIIPWEWVRPFQVLKWLYKNNCFLNVSKKKYNKITHIPGDSWSLTICLSVNCDRLWIRVKQWFVLQLVQSVGSAIRPLSISTDVVREHTIHLKNDSRISGIMLLVRITIPLIVISWSISIKLGPV